MMEQPAGTVTLVFTDIEGSTRLLRELGEQAYGSALAEHRRVVRQAFGSRGGYEVDSEGDAFFYAFASASQAVASVEAAMRALDPMPVNIRVGVHTGEPALDPPKYLGLDVHLAARVMAAGHGGQVLLTLATRDLVEVSTRDLGEHRLKDFEGPVALCQLGDRPFPPLRTIANTNLPRPASSFVGREREMRELVSLLRDGARFVTLTGPGGSGKTRLALEAAAELIGDFRAGVFWVGLAGLRDSDLVLPTIGQTLGTTDELTRNIQEREMLLLLDNFEQVISAAPELAGLVETCPNLRLLVTSRELLRVRGEVEYEVAPLPREDAIALFCARAKVQASPTVAELCHHLDDLPLAVELAAARTRSLSPKQMLERLGARLDLLQGGRDAEARQRTLRATIDWSYSLLTPVEQRLFARLAVFAGGCTLESAESVAEAALDTLQSLVEKSLLRHTDERFWMLDTIREFALDQLEKDGELPATRTEYRNWMERLAVGAHDLLRRNEAETLDRFRPEHGNVREIMELAFADGDRELALRLLNALHYPVPLAPTEALTWLERGLIDRDSLRPELVAWSLGAAAYCLFMLGDADRALRFNEDALRSYELLGDEMEIAVMQSRIGNLLASADPDKAIPPLEKAIATLTRLRRSLPAGGLPHTADGSAISLSGKTLADLPLVPPANEARIERQLAGAYNHLGDVRLAQVDLHGAAELFAAAEAVARKHGDTLFLSSVLSGQVEVAIALDNLDLATELANECLELAEANRDQIVAAHCFGKLAEIACGQGDIRRAATLWGAAERLDAELGQTLWSARKPEIEARLDAGVLADDESLAEGKALTLDEAVAFALRR
jgi:predicted ATPase